MVSRAAPLIRSYAWLTVLIIGGAASLLAYRIAEESGWRRNEAEFFRHADVHHTITREVLAYYEAGLFGLRNLFLADRRPTRAEFERVAQEIVARYPGIASLEWAPVVPGSDRAAFERQLSAEIGRPAEIMRTESGAQLVPVEKKAEYAAVSYITPAHGKEIVYGFDITSGLIAEAVARARAQRTLIVSPAVKLIEKPARDRLGVAWIWPIFPTATARDPAGYVLGIFRLDEMLDEALRRHPTHALAILYLDPLARDPAQRPFYYQPAEPTATAATWPSELEFRRSPFLREQPIPIGGKTWTVLYRPSPAWVAENRNRLPGWLLAAGLMLSGAAAAWVFQLTRRAVLIERVVNDRTAELLESRRELTSFLHSLPGMAYKGIYDRQFRLAYVSEGALALLGWPAEDFITGRAHLRDCIHPDDLPRVRAATRSAAEQSREAEFEYRIRTRDGQEKWVLSRGRGSTAPGSDRQRFEGLAIDITAQRRAEQQRLALERKLLEGQKLESLGLLAGGIAHDFNNLLTSILGNANLTRLTLPAASPAIPQLQAIETASVRAAELCRQMLAYAGKGNFVVEPIDLGALAEDLVPLLKTSIGRRAELRLEFARALPPVVADATQMRQIVMNLVLNAADAVVNHPNGSIAITTGVLHADSGLLARSAVGADCVPGEYVFLEVRDNGTGMTPEVRAKIFDPFFTTKFAGRGLGLAATIGIVRSHKGALQVESSPGQGSVFRLLLPPGKNPDARPPPSSAPTAGGWRHAGVTLVIDDEEPVRAVAVELLGHIGFTTREASDGETGLAIFRQSPERFDAVLLDLVMPGLTGEETLSALRATRPDVRVLLASGFSEGDLLRRLHSDRGRLLFLSKPFTRDALADKLRALLA